jgi:hypothetical protein
MTSSHCFVGKRKKNRQKSGNRSGTAKPRIPARPRAPDATRSSANAYDRSVRRPGSALFSFSRPRFEKIPPDTYGDSASDPASGKILKNSLLPQLNRESRAFARLVPPTHDTRRRGRGRLLRDRRRGTRRACRNFSPFVISRNCLNNFAKTRRRFVVLREAQL